MPGKKKPFYKTHNLFTGQRIPKKKRAANNKTRQVGFVKTPVDSFAQRKFIKLRWHRSYAVSASDNVNATGYRINDISLPYIGAATRPYGYDQWKVFYYKYRVHAAHVEVEANIRDAGASAVLFMGTSARGTAPPTLQATYDDPNYSHWTFTQERGIKRSRYATIAKAEGKSKTAIQATSGFSADFDSSPGNLCRMFVGLVNGNTQVGVNINVDLRVTITYYCELNEPKSLPNSTIPPS